MLLKIRSIVFQQTELIAFALREAFVSLIPYLILSSISTLVLQALHLWGNIPNFETIDIGIKLLPAALPILVLLTFSSQLAKLKNIDSATATLLSAILLMTLYPLSPTSLKDEFQVSTFSIFALLIPIFSTSILAKIVRLKWLPYPQATALADSVRMIYRYTPAFILSYLISLIIFEILYTGFYHIFTFNLAAFNPVMLNTEWMIVIRTFCSHIITFTGVHGTNLFDLVVNKDYLSYLIAPNLTAKNLVDTFVIFGGVGASLSLAIAILIIAKDRHAVRISKIALPFLVFNVTEILLYGLPIVLNRKLLIPFILVPICNLFLTLLAVHFNLFAFTTTQLPWTTPIFFSGYLATGGHLTAVFFQLLLLLIDVGAYMLFVRSYVNTQSTIEHLSLLKEKLNFSESIQTKQGLRFQEAQSFLVNSHLDIHRIIDLIIKNDLVMFYQPIIDIQNQRCNNFEALLRVKMQNGDIIEPYFIPMLERAGLSSVIDIWVCQQVRLDIEAWYEEGYTPLVNINLHPDTIIDQDSMRKILDMVNGFNVQFEIIERAYLIPEKTANNIKLLHDMKFKLVIDDFGTGYSCLEHLHNTSAETIKFDKVLLDITNTKKGHQIYSQSSKMCSNLGLRVVAEGVETEDQLNLVREVGIPFVQGWYFSKALPRSQAKQFALNFNKNNS